MQHHEDEMKPINETIANLSIAEMEARLQMEELDPRAEMWTGCSCVDFSIQPPQPACPPIGCSCVAVGTY